MKIVGICGKIGSGKDTFADYLVRKHKFTKLVMSDFIAEEMKKQGIEINRENLQNFSNESKQKYGKGLWAAMIINHAKANQLRRVVVSGIRDSEEVKMFRKLGNDFILVYVKADPKVRFERLRRRKTVKDLVNFDEFQEQEKNEAEKFDLYDKFEEVADYVIVNNSMVVALYSLAEEFLKKFKL